MFKKIFSCFLITLMFCLNSLPVLADETAWLVNVKKTDTNSVKNIVDFYARQTNMPEVSSNSDYTFVVVSSQKGDFWVALYEKNADDVSLFIYSPSDKFSVQKDLKIRFKKNNLKFSNERSSSLLKMKKQDAQKIIKDFEKKYNEQKQSAENYQKYKFDNIAFKPNNTNSVIAGYDFSDEAQARYDAGLQIENNSYSQNLNNQNQNNYRVENVPKSIQNQQSQYVKQGSVSVNQNSVIRGNVLPSGVTLLVLMQSAVSTSSLDSQDRLSATLKDDVHVGNVVIPAGSLVYGTATQAERAGGAYRDGSVTIKFDRLLTLEGEEYSFNSKPIVLKNTNSGTSSRAAKISGRMVAATLAGIAFAALAGAIGSTDDWGRTLAIGAATGAVGGGISLIGANGEEIDIKEGAALTVVTE